MIINIIMIILSIYLLCGFIGYGIMAKNIYNPIIYIFYGLTPTIKPKFKIALMFICIIYGIFTLKQSLYNNNFHGMRFW